MKILITGNMGYIGPSVVKQLRAAYPDAFLVGLDMGYFAHCLTDAEVLPETRVDMQYFADVRRLPEGLLDGVEAVAHLAAISNDPIGNVYEEVTLDVNHRASMELARQAKAAGVRSFAYASSCSTYGSAGDEARTEKSQVSPLTAYANSKVMTERDLAHLADINFKVTCLRFGTACGMSERLRLDLVVNDFVAAAVVSNQLTILSDGTAWRPLIHVKDYARAFDWAISRDRNDGGEYAVVNIGSEELNYRVNDMVGAIIQVMPGVEVIRKKGAQADKRSYRVNFDLFTKLAPDHQPTMDVSETVHELKNGLEAMNFTDKDFRNSQFIRLRVLSALREKGLLTSKLTWANWRSLSKD